MKLSKEEINELRNLKVNLDSDDIRIKNKIKEKLLDNYKIIYALNNKELQECDAEPDEYYGINILPYYMINPTQTNVQNFICFETQYDEINRYNKSVKYMQIIFYVLCEQKNIIDEKTYIARHDLLAALLLQEFNYKNYFGAKIRCISNEPKVIDTDYASRTIIFEQITDNNLVETRGTKALLMNKEIHT